MRALSWKQPYASLMLYGKIETRTWKTDYRGPVLICASKSGYRYQQIIDISGNTQLKRMPDKLFDLLNPLPQGSAIATGNLIDCRPMTPEDEDWCFVLYREGLWCHIYEDVRGIIPFPWKGTQGWSTVSQEIIDKIVFK